MGHVHISGCLVSALCKLWLALVWLVTRPFADAYTALEMFAFSLHPSTAGHELERIYRRTGRLVRDFPLDLIAVPI